MLLGDAATQHAETAKARATRRMIRALAHNEPAPRIARHFAQALENGVNERAISVATDRAIVRRLEEILADAQTMRQNAAYIHAAGVGYDG